MSKILRISHDYDDLLKISVVEKKTGLMFLLNNGVAINGEGAIYYPDPDRNTLNNFLSDVVIENTKETLTNDVFTILFSQSNDNGNTWVDVGTLQSSFSNMRIRELSMDSLVFEAKITMSDADKLRQSRVSTILKSGGFIADDDSVFLILGDSELSDRAMSTIDSGGGYDGLRDIGLTDSMALRILGVCNIKPQVEKYEAETAIDFLIANPQLLGSLFSFCNERTIITPSLEKFAADIRSNHHLYSSITEWHQAQLG